MTDRLFDAVLVANRGEIARRVIRTLHRLGIRSVAVYSDADAHAAHVREADAAVRIGPSAAAESYLDVDAVIAAARATGAQAIHPGYGFLSESPRLAHACAQAGIVFVGPGTSALEIMGDKIRAKEHVAAHDVPTVPGFSAAGMTDAEIAAAAEEAGYPLLVKPSAGGGGKGMQVVRSATELPTALETARRIARASFGDDTLLLERLIDRPRHIEVQVLADAHGAVIHLGERECTLQRRHQKVIEEAPSPVVTDETRERLGRAACAAAASVDYTGAGTVEFLVSGSEPDAFYFIEMNTRLQVEHPVTELVTGVDLVEQQLRVASGERLAIAQESVTLAGHAVEARVYAESPSRGFLPSTGEVLAWRAPEGEGVRVDAGVESGSAVTAFYDPMIAKVIAWGADRGTALERLDAALADTVILGVDTNIPVLRDLIGDADVRAGDLDTGLIDRRAVRAQPVPEPAALGAAAKALTTTDHSAAAVSPWVRVPRGWRPGRADRPSPVWFVVDDGSVVSGVPDSADLDAVTAASADEVWVHADGAAHRLRPVTRREAHALRRASTARTAESAAPELRAPMPGAIAVVHVGDGERVSAGARIVTIEAMKMEHPVLAPHDGVVRVDVAVGAQVRRDQIVARVAADHDTQEET